LADVYITEFVYDAPGKDSGAEWVEIYNSGPTEVDLTKWKVNDGSSHVLNVPPKNGSTGSLVLLANTFLILADDARAFTAQHPGFGSSVIDTVLALPNSNGAVSLIDVSGKSVSVVGYAKSLGASGTGNSLQKTSRGAWIDAVATPGSKNAESASPISQEKFAQKTKSNEKVQSKKSPREVTQLSTAVVESSSLESTPASPETPFESAENISQVASVNGAANISPWFWGTLGVIAVSVLGYVRVVRLRKDEWTIIEETD
jgi:hypothetical protein